MNKIFIFTFLILKTLIFGFELEFLPQSISYTIKNTITSSFDKEESFISEKNFQWVKYPESTDPPDELHYLFLLKNQDIYEGKKLENFVTSAEFAEQLKQTFGDRIKNKIMTHFEGSITEVTQNKIIVTYSYSLTLTMDDEVIDLLQPNVHELSRLSTMQYFFEEIGTLTWDISNACLYEEDSIRHLKIRPLNSIEDLPYLDVLTQQTISSQIYENL